MQCYFRSLYYHTLTKNVKEIISLFLLLPFFLASCKTDSNQNRDTGTLIYFPDTIHHFGEISMKNPIDSFNFKFKNTGDKLLVIYKVDPSCHCTSVKFTREPIRPGEESYIRVIYNGSGQSSGFFLKSVSVFSNASVKPLKLKIDGELVKK